MKTIILTIALLFACAIVTPASAQAFHKPKYKKVQRKHARKHGVKLLTHKVKQKATYRRQRKKIGV